MSATFEDIKKSGSLTSASPTLEINNEGAATAVFQLTGTWSGTVTFQAMVDEDGSPTWVAVKALKAGTTTYATTTTSTGIYYVAMGAVRSVRANFTTPTSGTVVTTIRASAAPYISFTEAAGGGAAVSVSDGADVALGTTTDAGVTTDTTGTVIGFLRGNIIKWVSALTQIGIVTEAAPATDTASSGLNGRLQRIAQRITSLIALVPAALTGSGNFKVSVAESTATVTVDTELPAAHLCDDTVDPVTATAVPYVAAVVHGMTQGGTGATSIVRAHTSASNAKANTINGLAVQSRLWCKNAAGTDDMCLSAPGASNTTGVGLLGVGPLVWDSTNWQRLKGNTDGSYAVGGYAPAAPTCTFTRGANATPYSIGDEVGTASTAPTTIAVGRINGGSGIIQGAQVIYSSYAATIPQLVLLVFNATVTLAGDNAQLNLSDADAAKLVCTIPLTYTQTGQYSASAAVAAGNTIFAGTPSRPSPHFVLGGSEQTLYCCLITLNAFTPIANSETLVVTLDVELN